MSSISEKRWCNIYFGAIFDVYLRYSIHNMWAKAYIAGRTETIFCKE
jgi:hypothetical protein